MPRRASIALAVEALSDAPATETRQVLEDGQSFADLLTMVEDRDGLDDDRYARLEEIVTRVFGRSLAVAIGRGRLGFVGDIVEPPPAPAAEARRRCRRTGRRSSPSFPNLSRSKPVTLEPEAEMAPVDAAPALELAEPMVDLESEDTAAPVDDATEASPLRFPSTRAGVRRATGRSTRASRRRIRGAVRARGQGRVRRCAGGRPRRRSRVPALELEPESPAPPTPRAHGRADGRGARAPSCRPSPRRSRNRPAPTRAPTKPRSGGSPRGRAGQAGNRASTSPTPCVKRSGSIRTCSRSRSRRARSTRTACWPTATRSSWTTSQRQNRGASATRLNSLKPSQAEPVGQQLTPIWSTTGRLRETYAEFIRATILGAVPEPGLWFQFRILESKEDTRNPPTAHGRGWVIPSSPGQRLASDGQRYAEHKFRMTLGPLTTRFVLRVGRRQGGARDRREDPGQRRPQRRRLDRGGAGGPGEHEDRGAPGHRGRHAPGGAPERTTERPGWRSSIRIRWPSAASS